MSIVFDIVIVAVIALSLWSGWRNGLVKSVMHFASGILAFFAAAFFTPHLGPFISDTFIRGPLSSEVSETLSSLLGIHSESASRTTADLFADMPSSLTGILERFGVDTQAFVAKFSSSAPATEKLVSDMADAVVTPVSLAVSSAIAFILVFVLVTVVLRIVTAVIGVAFELPVLKQCNELAGLLFGLVSAVLYAVVLSNVFVNLAEALSVFDPNTFSAELINDTYLVRFFSGLRLSMLHDILASVKNG